MIEAVIFDIDGTILNTIELILQAYEHTLSAQGIKMDRAIIRGHVGPTLTAVYSQIAPGKNAEKMVEAHRAFQSKRLDLTELYPQVAETLDALRKKGIKMAAVTNREIQSNAIKALELVGIAKYFEIVLSAEDVITPKPHPEGLLKALHHLGVSPKDAVMVGDTYIDVETGIAAGTKTVGITHGISGKSVEDSNPDYIINTIPDLLTLDLFSK